MPQTVDNQVAGYVGIAGMVTSLVLLYLSTTMPKVYKAKTPSMYEWKQVKVKKKRNNKQLI